MNGEVGRDQVVKRMLRGEMTYLLERCGVMYVGRCGGDWRREEQLRGLFYGAGEK